MPKKYRCIHCGRKFKEKGLHRCKGNIRRKNLIFIDQNGTTWKQGWYKSKGSAK